MPAKPPSYPALVYLPLEPVKSRYTYQLCNPKTGWVPTALRKAPWREFYHIDPSDTEVAEDIKVGAVLDATSRTKYSMAQCQRVQDMLANGCLRTGDVVYIQDFYTPGLDSIFYSAHLYGIKLRFFAMVHAQSVDPHDFTHAMISWMRPLELAYDSQMDGLFVASTVHKEQLRAAGFKAPIHVVSLPISREQVLQEAGLQAPSTHHYRANRVVFSSRLDKEKNPDFMLKVAQKFLRMASGHGFEWWITTSSPKLRSYNNQDFIRHLRKSISYKESRIKIKEGLTKQEYYQILATSRFQFNCSSQDYVSWTALEAGTLGCQLLYPYHHSFTDFIKEGEGYKFADSWGDEHVQSAVDLLCNASKEKPIDYSWLAKHSDDQRHRIAMIVSHPGRFPEYNCWSQIRGR